MEGMIRRLREIASEERAWAIDISISPDCPSRVTGSGNIRLQEFGFEDLSTGSWIIDMRRSFGEIEAGVSRNAKRKIKEAEVEGYSIRPIRDRGEMDAYYEIHAETYRRTGANPHPKEYFLGIYDRFVAQGLAKCWVAENRTGRVVAFTNIATFKGTALYWTTCCRDEDYRKGVYYLLLWHAIRAAKNAGLEWFDCAEAFPNAPEGSKERGLSDFKRKFGGSLYPYHKGRLILEQADSTTGYSFPQRVIRRLRNVRLHTESIAGKAAADMLALPFRGGLGLARKMCEFSNPHVSYLRPFWSEVERSIGWGREALPKDSLEEFKAAFRQRLGCSSEAVVVPTGSGRGALEVILRVLKEKHPERNEVILPSYGCKGTLDPVRSVGLLPVFADINGELLTEDAELARHFSKKTLAVLLVHLCGKSLDTQAITAEAVRQGITPIEDHCQNLGGIPRDRDWPGLAVFAFGLGKNAMATAGGAVVANVHHAEFVRAEAGLQEESMEAAQRRFAYFEACHFSPREFERLRAAGGIPSSPGDSQFGCVKMNFLDARLMMVQLLKLDEILSGRKDHALRLRSKLGMFPSIFGLQTADAHIHTKLSVRLADRRLSRRFQEWMTRRGIELEPMYVPLHLRHFASAFRRESLPVCEKIYHSVVNVPVRPNLMPRELEKLAREIETFGHAHITS